MSWLMTAEGDTPTRTPLAGTDQQERFWSAVLDPGDGNMLLSARAGTGKSASCREAMWRLIERVRPAPMIRYCCFNKSIADEFRGKCPPGVEVGTMHSFGFRACARAFGSKLERQKTYLILDRIGAEDLPRKRRKAISKLVSIAKNRAEMPMYDGTDEQWKQIERLDRLMISYQIETDAPESVATWASEVLVHAAKTTDVIDFDDMLWLPVVHGLGFSTLDYLFVDECQDLNPIQHDLMPLLMGGGRAVAVGDPFQAIYAFRGADSRSVDSLTDALGAEVMPLTRTFRCPRSHVELAAELVPDFEAAEDNREGSIEDAPLSDLLSIARPGDLVLCRCNAPLVTACLRAISARKPAYMRGRAIGENLIDLIQSLEPSGPTDLIRRLRIWEARQIAALEAKEADESEVEEVTDRVTCLESIAADSDSIDEAVRLIRSLFDDRDHADRVTFSSVHRAKGSEAESVHFIDIPHGKPGEELTGQRRNLRYVAITRSLDHLTFVDPES